MIVRLTPFDREVATGQSDGHLAVGACKPRSGDRGGASRRAAGFGEAGAALPGSDHDVVACRHGGKRDIGALWKQGMMLHRRTDPAQVVAIDMVDPKDRVR